MRSSKEPESFRSHAGHNPCSMEQREINGRPLRCATSGQRLAESILNDGSQCPACVRSNPL